MLVNHFLSQNVDLYPEKEALIASGFRYSYKDLGEMVDKFANYLLSMDTNKSDRILVFLENSLESVVSIFGIMEAGGVFVVINPQMKAKKMQYIINDSGAKILITNKSNLERIKEVLADCHLLDNIILVDSDNLEIITVDNRTIKVSPFYPRNDFDDRKSQIFNIVDDDLASIIYTSGSTGFPKGVVLTHGNMSSAADSIITYLENTPEDIIFNVLPLSFDYGLYQVLMAFKFGGTVVLEKAFVFPHQVLQRVKEENATGFPIVPAIANIMLRLKDLSKYELPNLRYISNTAQKLPKKTIFALMDAFPNVKMYSMYGLTECKRVSYLPPEKLKEKPESVGKAMPNTEAFLVDENGKRISKPGVIGELVVRGPHIMVGYWNKPKETAEIIKIDEESGDRLLYSGDLFTMDEDEDLYFHSRKDDMIKTAGEKVSPKEIENVLYELDDVQEAAVFGVSDDILGQAIKAVVGLRKGSTLTERDILAHCLKHLENFMIPKIVEIRGELPKTSTGKISKKDLMDTK